MMTALISSLDIDLLGFSVSSCSVFGSLWFSGNAFVSSRLPNLLAYSCSG